MGTRRRGFPTARNEPGKCRAYSGASYSFARLGSRAVGAIASSFSSALESAFAGMEIRSVIHHFL